MAFITVAGEQQIALKQASSETLNISKFVFAYIDGLGSEPTDRVESLPASADIVDQLDITKSGYVNTNQVVYSVVMGSDVGDYQFNWVGLIDDENVLIAVVYVPITQKSKTSGSIEGNTLTRNFLMAYSGIQSVTAISVPAETWQIDFSARLSGIDERERLSNLDIYDHEGFLGDGWLVTGSASPYTLTAGIGYVGGIRAKNANAQTVEVSTKPNAIWLDISLQGDISDMSPVVEIVVNSADQSDYNDENGIPHFLTKIADIASDGTVTDTRAIYQSVEVHEAKDDPHPQYHNASKLNQGTVPVSRLPAATETAIGAVEKATSDEALSGEAGKFPDSAGVLTAIRQWGYGNVSSQIDSGITDFDAIDFSTLANGQRLRIGTSAINSPDGVGRQWMVDVIKYTATTGQIRVTTTSGAGYIYTRQCYAGTWQGWFTVFTSANTDVALTGLRGSVQFFMTSTTPAGFIKGNAPTLSRTTYADLYQWAVDNGMMYPEGTQDKGQFGDGDGSTTFTGPEVEGYVIRALDETGDTDPDVGRAVGSSQEDQFQSHAHTARHGTSDSGTSSIDGASDYDGTGSSTNFIREPITYGGGAVRTGTETRMKNIALVAYIKY